MTMFERLNWRAYDNVAHSSSTRVQAVTSGDGNVLLHNRIKIMPVMIFLFKCKVLLKDNEENSVGQMVESNIVEVLPVNSPKQA